MELSGISLRRTASCCAVAIAHRAQSLPQPFLFGYVATEGERPGAGENLAVDVGLLHQPLDELPHLVRVLQAVTRGCRTVAVLGMTDHNSDAVVQDGIKPVLIGQIIADEDRQQWFLAGYPGGDPLQRLALVPIHIRS